MTEQDLVNGWLADLAAEIGAPGLHLDGSGLCAFRYDDANDIRIEVPAGAGLVFFYAPLQAAPKRDVDAFNRHLLVLNAYMLGSRGGALGLDPQADEIVLSRAEPVAGLGPELFERMLTNFIEAVSALKAELAEFRPADVVHAPRERFDPTLTMIPV